MTKVLSATIPFVASKVCLLPFVVNALNSPVPIMTDKVP